MTTARVHQARVMQHAAFEVSLALVAAATDNVTLAKLLVDMNETELRMAAATLAAMVDDETLTLKQLRERAFSPEGCHPALWGDSWRSESEHGTRPRFVAGCRGAACLAADTLYQQQRHQRQQTRLAAVRDDPAASTA